MTNIFVYKKKNGLEKISEQMRNVYSAAIAPVPGIHSVLCGRA